MAQGKVVALCIAAKMRGPMEAVQKVLAIAGHGLEGDRYCSGEGSYNQGEQGKRQVTLINALFFEGTGYSHLQSRRNIVTEGVELMYLIGREFHIGPVKLRGLKYCEPCKIPGKDFAEIFHDRGGLIAEILEGGEISVGDSVIPPAKKY